MNNLPFGLPALGWDASVEAACERAGLSPDCLARVVSVHRGGVTLRNAEGERTARLSGRLRHETDAELLPSVGDWVGFSSPGDGEALVTHVLPRRTELARVVAGRASQRQVIAANVDTVFVVTSLDRDFNPRRLERYVAFAWDSGATPVVLLTKSDLCEDVPAAISRAMLHAPGVEVLSLSALSGTGIEEVSARLLPGRTAVLVGSSGTGKSTLLNRLSGDERQATRGLDSAGRGRHTTTHRELFALSNGALVVDTPGMRELGVLVGREALDDAFADVEGFAAECRFQDCSHREEPGCAVRAAAEDGSLPAERVEAFHHLERERAWLESRHDDKKRRARMKEISVAIRAFYRDKRRG